jgi:hypothetical protein
MHVFLSGLFHLTWCPSILSMMDDFILLCGLIILVCMYTIFSYPFICWWPLGWFQVFTWTVPQ